MGTERVFVSGTSELLRKLVYAVDVELDRYSDRAQDFNDQLEGIKKTLEMIEAVSFDAERKQVNDVKSWLKIEELMKKLVYVVDGELARGGDWELKRLKKALEMIEAVTFDAERKQVNDAAVKHWLIKLKEVAYDADDVLDEYFYKAVMQSKRNVKVIPVLANPINSLPGLVEKLDRLSSEKSNIEWMLLNPLSKSSPSSVDYNQLQEKVSVISTANIKLSDHSNLKLRYDNLSTYLKQCLSYFSLFPKDWKFDRDTLIQLWMAEGFLESSNGGNQNSLEDIGIEYFKNLFSFSLFQDIEYDELGDIITFKLRNFVHEFAQSIAGPHEATVFENLIEYEKTVHQKKGEYEEGITPDETRRLQLAADPYFAEFLVFSGKKLRTILCSTGFCPRVDIHSSQLRVLHLFHAEQLNVPSLLRLRYLSLTRFDVSNISISQLYLLQTLKLSGCKNVHMLLEEIGSLEMLRHLDFSSSDFKVLPESISMLFNLRSLDISRCNISVLPLSVGSLKNLLFLDISHTPITELPDSISRIYSLQRLNFRYCKNLEALPRKIGALTQLRSLNLEGSGIVELPDSICRIYNLERLEFRNCSELKALPHKFKALTRLRSLDLEGTKITELPESLTSNLWKFKSVNIRVLVPYLVRKLEEKKNALPVLRTTESRESSGIKDLAGIPSLRVLEIRCLENVTGTKDAERADLKYKKNLRELSLKWENEEANNNSVMVLEGLRPHRNLEKLVIENFGGARLPKWMDSSSCYLPNLVELYLSNCNSCKKLPALGVLPCLRVLWIYGMRSMNCLGQEFYYQENDEEEHKEDVEVTILFRSLTRLELGDMDNLEEWVAPPPPYISFPVLETLCIIGCCELTSIPDFQSCTSLQELTIEDCDKLNKEFPSEPITTNRYLFKQITSGPSEDSGIQDIAALEIEKFLHISNLENVRGGKEGAERATLKDKQHLEDLYLSWNASSSSNDDDSDECTDRSLYDGMVLQGLLPHPNLKILSVSGFRGLKLPNWMGLSNYLPQLVDLYFYGCNSCEQLPALGMLPCLRILQIEGMNSVQSLGPEFYYQQQESSGSSNDREIKEEEEIDTEKQATTVSSSSSFGKSTFPSLVELSLKNMSILEEWTAPHHSFKSFSSLEKLIVSGCLRLKSIPFTSCSSFKSLVLRNTNDEAVNSILARTGGDITSSLASVSIQYSPQLEYFPVVLLPNDTSIQSLEIAHCSNFQGFRIIENEEFQAQVSSDTGYDTSISSLRSLKLFDCPALTSLPDLRGWTSLTELWIEDCDKLKESFSYSLKSLKYLKTLYVDRVIDLPQK